MNYYYDSQAAELIITDFYQTKLFQEWYNEIKMKARDIIRIDSFLSRNHTIRTLIVYTSRLGLRETEERIFTYHCEFENKPKGDLHG